MGGLDWRICFKSRLLNCARTIVAALWDFDVLHSGLLAEPDGLENGADHGLERGPAIEWGHEASMEAQELLSPQHCFMEWFCNASLRAKKNASAMFLLLRFLFGSLAWYARFPLPCYKSVLRKSLSCLFGPLRHLEIMS